MRPETSIWSTPITRRDRACLKLSPQGKELAQWHVFPLVRGEDNGPSGIALDPDGNILVTDAQGILKLSPKGTLLATIGADSGIYDVQSHVAVDRKAISILRRRRGISFASSRRRARCLRAGNAPKARVRINGFIRSKFR